MSVAIKAENISKAYQIGEFSTGTITKDIDRWWKLLRGKEDPYLMIGETNDRSTKGESNVVWSLKDINFEINQGDAVGIIGKNGAGKSTLLKILSRVTTPTTGNIKVKGRIASLLEVGTGFHPELTGKENIYLNGAILGMRKHEIKKHFDAIVDFSGVERYIDTPVKRYSSGMYVRLAFAVAAHLESEILIVDEVLAVGDAEFQKKCLGKMGEVSKGEGRTILFVSHNMMAIQKLCNQSILLKNGMILKNGDVESVVQTYLNQGDVLQSEYLFEVKNQFLLDAFAYKLVIEDSNNNKVSEIPVGQPWKIKVFFNVTKPIDGLIIGLGMLDSQETPIRTSWQPSKSYSKGEYVAIFEENSIVFSSGRYKFLVGLSRGNQPIQYIDQEIWMTISEVINSLEGSVINASNGIFINQMKMEIEKN